MSIIIINITITLVPVIFTITIAIIKFLLPSTIALCYGKSVQRMDNW